MTIKDIARLANVSASTVSRSLNDSSLISTETKSRICEIARTHGFEFNSGARSLQTKRTGTIGMILPDDFDQLNVHVYHSALHNHLRRTLERADLDLIVGFYQNRFTGIDNIVKLVRRNKVDGFIVILPALPEETEEYLREKGVPYVYSHYPPPDRLTSRSSADRIYVDHRMGGGLAGELFVRHKFARIVSFRNEGDELELRQRAEGFSRALALADYDVELQQFEGQFTYESGYEIAQARIDEMRNADAIFALNDLMAIGVLHALQAHSIRVPDDVSLVGYDDSPLSSALRPRLTSVAQPVEEVAFLTCERLIAMIEDRHSHRAGDTKSIALQPRLVPGETTPWIAPG